MKSFISSSESSFVSVNEGNYGGGESGYVIENNVQ